ncbi:uncharacterized protein LOC117610126 [Osmia lignaria lignaria]|uniref:uncharacterized protein LOC117610126 n=1 Tax=Osmia lignaria lignaria TaxID=1437193 RepID=UPI00402BF204
MPHLATLIFALFILQSATAVQSRTHRSPEIDGLPYPHNLPESLRIVPHEMSPIIEYKVAGPNNNLGMASYQSSQPNIEDREPSTDHLANRVPDSWRVIPRQMEPPRIEMQLIKEHVPKTGANWVSLEYTFSDNYGNSEPISELRNNANGNDGHKVSQSENSRKKTSGLGLGSRTIVNVPFRPCPPGQRRNYKGVCTKVY